MKRRLCLLLAGAAGGAAATAHAGDRPTLSDPDNQPILLTQEVEPGPHHELRQSTPRISPILYMNRCEGGCEIRSDQDDAILDASTIPDEDTTLSEFEHSDGVWQDTVACVREVYAPYNVEVVTEDPGDEPHHQAVVAGTADELGLEPPPGTSGEIGGVAPLANDCRPLDNVLSFTFANTLEGSALDLCWTVAHEAGHAYGLDHVYECEDPMTYVPGCGTKYFRDRDLSCGEFEERACQCGGDTQNSHEVLSGVFGEDELPEPPEVEITNLDEDQDVSDGDSVAFTAEHPRGIRRVALRINGTEYNETAGNAQDEGTSYNVGLPQHPDGVLHIAAVAYGDLEVEGKDEVTVHKGDPCTSDDHCFAGMECEDGGCRWPEPFLEIGEPCQDARECTSGLCPEAGGDRYCSERCDLGADNPCGAGLECVDAGDGELGACWPEGAGGGCAGCAASGRGGLIPALALALAAAWALTARRRRLAPAA